VKVDAAAYAEAVDYLTKYGEDDWMMLSVVVSEAHNVLESPSKADVLAATLSLAASLIEVGVVPGDFVADERDFVPWDGSAERWLQRIRSEMNAMVERDELPIGPEICWFHKIDG
jgi:hypothetical protein